MGNTKASTRHGRDKGANRDCTLRGTVRLPPQKITLTVTKNKAQLIGLICKDITSHTDDFTQYKLVVTGSDPAPVEVSRGVLIRRQDMSSTQKEGIYLLCNKSHGCRLVEYFWLQMVQIVFVLFVLLPFCYQDAITSAVMMVSPAQGRAVIHLNATIEKHRSTLPDLLAAHGLTECDTVVSYFGIRKGVALKVLRGGLHSLSYLGDTTIPLSDATHQATPLILACYGQSQCQSMTEARQ